MGSYFQKNQVFGENFEIRLRHTQRLPPGYRDLIQFFSHNPGLVKWTGTALLLYFNAGCLEVRGPNLTRAKERHDRDVGGGSIDTDQDVSGGTGSDGDRDNVNRVDTVDRGGNKEETKCCCTVM